MERQRDGETERRRDGEKERQNSLYLSIPPSLRPFASLSLCLSVSLSLCLSVSPSPRLPRSGQQPEWSAQSSGALAKLFGVFFINCDRGWVVGSNGALLATEDGGAKWSRQTLPER